MQDFSPQKILVEKAMRGRSVSARILARFPRVPVEEIDDLDSYKEPIPITGAKKILALAACKGEAVKPFPKIDHALNLGDYVFNPVSNCHLECTYCILQSYLHNNPMMTVFANDDHYVTAIERLSREQAGRILRLGTGELSDSLALDPLTGFSETFVPLFARLPNAYLELKTKTDCIANLQKLDPKGRTVVSWSLAPERVVQSEELKCASLADRLKAARDLQDRGFPIGLHLDPLLFGPDWKREYGELVAVLAATLDPKRVAWASIGSLRFDKDLKRIAAERFPHTKIFTDDFIAAPDGKMRYFKTIRLEMYRHVWTLLKDWSEDFPRYLCMEPPWVWEAVRGEGAPAASEMETVLVNRLEALRRSS